MGIYSRIGVIWAAVLFTITTMAPTATAGDEDRGIELNVLRPQVFEVATPESGWHARARAGVTISFNFDPTVSAANQALFAAAGLTWQSRIPNYASGITGPASIVINVSEPAIDGQGGILGSAGPSNITPSGGLWLVTTGQMRFDSADVASMVSGGVYDDVIEHEMGHVLGIGTLWEWNNLYTSGSYQYTGVHGLAAWKAGFSGQSAAAFVPVEDNGGSGTAEGHWDENNWGSGSVGIVEISSGIDMQYEQMTGWLNAPTNYSSLTHRSMADLGYEPAATGSLIFSDDFEDGNTSGWSSQAP